MLNLGCGDKIIPGYINIDAAVSRAGLKPDIVADKAKPAGDAALDKAWNEETQSWEPIDLYSKLK